MGGKRALIVDDSKSARLFLARILEKYEIDVDDAENAEAAIQYLTTHRPDVIFMDHLMPGMDGFQAVQAIKSNPITATIPILMYTSQEGELYLGQARALGAVGVLPKQIKPADVSKVLYQLHLLVDRRSAHQTSFRPLNLAANDVDQDASANDSGLMPKPLTDTALREQFAELRRALVAGVDTQTERIIAEVRALLLEAQPVPTQPEEKVLEVQGRGQSPQWAWLVASFALAIALATTALWWQQSNQLRALDSEVTELRDAVVSRGGAGAAGVVSKAVPPAAGTTAAPADDVAQGPAGAKPLPTDAKPLLVPVPYGAEALGGARLEVIRQLLERLVKEGRSAVVEIKAYAGRFCLIGNASEGFSLAPEETVFSKCDLIGNPIDEALLPAQRTPLPFANLAAAMRNASHGALSVQSSQGDPNTTAQPYPTPSGQLTAGDWNRVAAANNRIEIRVR